MLYLNNKPFKLIADKIVTITDKGPEGTPAEN